MCEKTAKQFVAIRGMGPTEKYLLIKEIWVAIT